MSVPRLADLDDLVGHLRALGQHDSDEGPSFTELDHGLQCAALLGEQHPDDLELIVAGLVHDIAHPWDGPGQPRHAALGAAAIRPLLSERVAALVAGHVAAKRYLVAVDPHYRAALTPGSLVTLAAQGEAFSDVDARAFAVQPHADALVALRRADDRAKVAGAVVPDLDHWLPTIAAVHELRTG